MDVQEDNIIDMLGYSTDRKKVLYMGIVVGIGFVIYMWTTGWEYTWIAALAVFQFIASVFTAGTDPGIGSLIAFVAALFSQSGC